MPSSLIDDTDEALILQDLLAAGVIVRSFTTMKTSLEDIFIRVYGDENDPALETTAAKEA